VPGRKRQVLEEDGKKVTRAPDAEEEANSEDSSTSHEIADLKRMQEQLRRRADELEVINSIAAMTNASLDLGTILDNAVKSLIRLTQADHGVLYLLDESRPGRMRPIRYRGMTKREAYALAPLDTPTSQSWAAMRQQRVIHIPDIHAIEAYPPLYKAGIQSFVTIPIFSNERPLGSMNLGMRSIKVLQVFSTEALTSIGNQIGVALEHARLLNSMESEIEERRKAEAELRESESRYRQIIFTSPEAIALTDVHGKYLIANDGYARLFGYESSEKFLQAGLYGKDLLSPEFLARLQKLYWSLPVGETLSGERGLMRRRDGSEFLVEISTSILRDARDVPTGMIGIVRDVTELHRTEEALRRSEERYRTLAEAAHDQIFILDREDRIVYINQYAAQVIGKKADKAIGRPGNEYFGGQIGDRQKNIIQGIFKSGNPRYSENLVEFSGRSRWLGTWLAPIFDQEGTVIQVLGVARDITDYKETASRLAESEQRSRDIIERSVDGYFFIDTEGVFRNCNLAFAKVLRFKPEELVDLRVESHADPEIRERIVSLFGRAMSGKSLNYAEIYIPLADGERRWVSFNMRRVMKKGIVIGIEGFLRDITEQKEIAEALRISEARYRSLFDSIRYEVYGMDLDGRFRETNAAFLESWGPALGRTVSSVIKDRTVARTLRMLIKQVISNRSTVQAAFSVERESGMVYYSAILSPVLTEDGTLIGLVGMNLDVTGQVTTLESLRMVSMRLVQVQEEERRRIAREIHDSLGQHLTALQFEVTAASNALQGSVEIPKALRDAVNTIEESITMAQNLCYDLRPPLLDDFGLESALRDHVMQYQEKWGITVEFTAEKLGHPLGRDAETALFRVAQEAMNNVLKHAQASTVRIGLGRLNGRIFLRIQDDGRGFEPAPRTSPAHSDHFGLMTMSERIELLGGELEVVSKAGIGTIITAWLPAEGREEG